MHVCHVINNLEVGGAETMLLKLLHGVRSNRIESSVISLIGKGVIGPQIEQLGVRVDSLGMVRRYENVASTMRLGSLLRERRPDIVCTWMYQADLLGGLASRLVCPRTPVIWNLRTSLQDAGILGRTTRMTRRMCASLSRCLPSVILCNSGAVRAAHAELGYAASKLRVIANGFDLKKFHPSREHRADVRKELGIPAKTRLVGMMARFSCDKDHAMFLRAAELISRRLSDVHFVLCGTDVTPENRVFNAMLDESPYRDRIHLLGARSDMPRLQASLDIGVLASITWEGFPNAIGEAMACGVPCIVTDTGGSPEVVGGCGQVVAAGDAVGLADAGLRWLSLPQHELTEIGERARNRIEREFSLNAVTEQYVNLWRELFEPTNATDSNSYRRAA